MIVSAVLSIAVGKFTYIGVNFSVLPWSKKTVKKYTPFCLKLKNNF